MSLYSKSSKQNKTNRRSRLSDVKKTSYFPSRQRTRNNSKVTKLKAKSASFPHWLKSFRLLQTSSAIVAYCLIASTLVVYGWSVYNQQGWSKQYRNLESLQKEERDLVSTNEGLKNAIAEEVDTINPDLTPATPDRLLFIPASRKKAKSSPLPSDSATPIQPSLGY